MPEFEPFPILDQTMGLFNAKANWQSPVQSWRELTNFFINNGRLTCRSGQSVFGTLYPGQTYDLLTQNPMNFVLPYFPVRPAEPAPSLYAVTITDGTYVVVDDGAGNLYRTGTLDVIGTIDYVTGTIVMTWPVGTAVNLTITWEWERVLPVVGIFDFFPRSSSEYLVAFDTKRMYLWSEAQQRFTDILLADTFTGTERDYFWFVPFDDRLIFCNGVNPVYKYEPLVPSVLVNPTNFDGIAGNDIDTVQMGVRHKGMVHYLYPTEATLDYPQRARRTKVGDPTSFRDQFAFTDAPTDKAIVSAVPVADSIIVFFERNETWRHRFTNDPKNPYSWERISRERGSWARFAAVEIDNGAITLDGGGLVATDGQRVNPYRDDITEKYPFDINTNALDIAYGIHYPERLEAWISVPTGTSDVPTSVLVINTTDNVFSRLDFVNPPRVLGFYRSIGVLLWDDIAGTWDENTLVPDNVDGGVGSVIILGGASDNRVLALNTGPDDIGALFPCHAMSQFINPFGALECHFGYVDLYMKPVENKSVRVKMYRDYSTTPYYQFDVDLTPNPNESTETIIRRVNVNQIGFGHAIEIELIEGLAGWNFYGMVPYMKPAGRISIRPLT